MMKRNRRPRILNELIAVASVGLAILLRLALGPILGPRQPFFAFYLAVVSSTLFLGVRPAFVALIFGLLAGTGLFILQDKTIAQLGPHDLASVTTYTVTSLVMICLCESTRRLRKNIRSEAVVRRRAEDSERRQREWLEAILSSLGEGVIVSGPGPDRTVAKLNPMAEQLTGWGADEAIGRPISEVLSTRDRRTSETRELPDSRVLREEVVRRTGEPIVLLRRDGSSLMVEASLTPLRGPGRGGVVVILRDVTERLRIDEAERSDRERLRLALEAGRLGTWSWDLLTGTFDRAENVESRDDLPPGTLDGTFETFRSFIHPDDLPDFDRRIRRAIRHGGPYESEFRIRRPDGSVVWLSDRGSVVLDGDGRPIRFFGVSADITDRKRDEDALRASELHFRSLADSIPQVVWTSKPDGTLDSLNRRWYDLVGRSPDNPAELNRWKVHVHPDDLPALIETWQASCRSSLGFEAEFRLRDRDGAYRWHLGLAVPVLDGQGAVTRWIGSATDIDDRKRAERTLRLLADAGILLSDPTDLDGMVRRVPGLILPALADSCVVYLLDDDSRTIRRAAVAHHSPELQVLMAEALGVIAIDPDGDSPVARVLRTGRSELVPETDPRLLDRLIADPERRERVRPAWPKSHLIVPLTIAGRTIGAFGLAMTDSGRRFTPDDLPVAEDLAVRAAIAVENARLYQELSDSDRRKSEFLAVLAHELRNPLAPIRTALDLLQIPESSDRDDPEALDREAVRLIASGQVSHMARLIEDLMDVTRISRGTIELRREPIELVSLADRVVSAVDPQATEAGLSLRVELPDAPLWIQADPVRIEQVLWNLLTNAVKYSDPGGRVTLRVAPDGDRRVTIRVQDSGIGIAPEILPTIFDLFVRADRESSGQRGGLGIGLSLVRMLVELHGGEISAHSDGLKRGSEFLVELPRIAGPPARFPDPDSRSGVEAGPSPSPDEPTPPARPLRRRILLVDDNRYAAITLGRLLGTIGGHEVRLVHDGPDALIAADEFEPEIVLLDIGLPTMDGYEVARRLRQTPLGGRLILIALTGWGQQDDFDRSRRAGFDHHLVKPVDSMVINRLIASIGPRAIPSSRES